MYEKSENAGPIELEFWEVIHTKPFSRIMLRLCRAIDRELAKLAQKVKEMEE